MSKARDGMQVVVLGERLGGEDVENDVQKVEVNRSVAKQINADDLVASGPGRLFGIFVSSGSGSLRVHDGTANTDPDIINTFTVSAATMYDFPAIEFGEGLYIDVTGTVECTVFYKKEVA